MSAIDELGMATERLRVRLADEPKPKVLHIIEPHEVGRASTAPHLNYIPIYYTVIILLYTHSPVPNPCGCYRFYLDSGGAEQSETVE